MKAKWDPSFPSFVLLFQNCIALSSKYCFRWILCILVCSHFIFIHLKVFCNSLLNLFFNSLIIINMSNFLHICEFAKYISIIVFNLIQLWSENSLGMFLIIVNSLRLIWWPNIWYNVSRRTFHVHLRTCILVLWGRVLYRSLVQLACTFVQVFYFFLVFYLVVIYIVKSGVLMSATHGT